MITFDLACDRGHRFEGWFGNREDFDRQLAQGLVTCPLCGSARVQKRLSAVAVHVGRRTAAEPRAPQAPSVPEPPRPEAFLRAVAQFVETHFEDVGARFAQEARRMEDGEADARSIRGTTTPEEQEALREDGIEFLTIALPKYDA